MVWRNREGSEADRRFKDLEEEMSLENLQGTNVLTEAPSDLGEGRFALAVVSGTLYLYTKYNSTLHRVAFTAV